MAGWEYRTIPLNDGRVEWERRYEIWEDFVEELGKAGQDGWEAVGPVTIEYEHTDNGPFPPVPFKMLLLKRQVS